MTIKVTRKRPPSLTCSGCEAELEFEFTDLEGFHPDHDYTETGREAVGIRCPECREITEFKAASAMLIQETWERQRKRKKG